MKRLFHKTISRAAFFGLVALGMLAPPSRGQDTAPAKANSAADDSSTGDPNSRGGVGSRPMIWSDPDKTEPPNTHYRTFHSDTINGDVSYLIYLPPDYETQTGQRYPAIYWLHGSGGNQRKGGGMAERLDQAIREGKAQPMIVVLVNGLAGETMYCDTRDGQWPLESVIIKDLIPHIDSTYRTIATREGRGVEGFSMGGFGAAHFGFKYPEVFGVVSILAPALLGPDIEGDSLQRKWSALYSKAMGNDLAYFQENNPFDLAVKNADQLRGRSKIRIVPHGTPEHWLIPRCEKLHELLDDCGIANELILCADVQQHSYPLLYDKLSAAGIGFFADAFPKDAAAAKGIKIDILRGGTRIRLIVGDADKPQTQARTKELYARTEQFKLQSSLTIVPGVGHQCPKLYEVMGDPEFTYYAEVFPADTADAAMNKTDTEGKR